jgi:DNA-binding LytR/AlgR family response regulator
MKVLIVDDEPIARRRLERMLSGVPEVTVVGTAADGEEARAAVETLQPDVVLLDIDMPECDGLTLAATANLPAVVFVTAHREHALEAFDVNAVDYVLKPVSRPRLLQALERVRARTDPSAVADAGRHALADQRRPPRLSARTGDVLHVFDAREIARLHARDKATLFWVNGVEYVLDESLSELERRLGDWDFVRVHRAELVNLGAVVSVHLGSGESSALRRDGSQVPVSRRALPLLKQRLK